ncbi:hypothetical protein HNQ75_004249 [Rhizobium flavum]|uniref:Uncharacterized protein n=1 Tax=Pseudorhizobium flavum TaxID=1335061 RepID=A0A7W9Z1E5_9HYPH|nr:hypothetical protein [Pseudorhizobium flavum]CAD6631327.1 hypothetical protein RFYW14_04452 [Pseudorhizobium flavum]
MFFVISIDRWAFDCQDHWALNGHRERAAASKGSAMTYFL